MIYSSGDNCNFDGLRRAKKIPISAAFGAKKKFTEEDLMEDDHYCGMSFNGDETKSFFAIYDGFGGLAVARESRRMTPLVIEKALETKENSTEMLEMVFDRIENDMEESICMDIGCTCTMVYVWKESEKMFVQTINVGDSTCFVKKFTTEGNTIITMSQDHKVTSPVEQERLKTSGLLKEGQKRINGVSISRCFGNRFVKEVGVGMISTPYISEVVEVRSGDEIIVCSDGIWDVVTPEEAFTMMESVEMNALPEELMKTAMKNVDCKDNVTVIAIRIK